MGTFRARTQAQREQIIETRLRAIETGEWMEKLGLHELLGIAPPIGPNFKMGESSQDLKARAARAGLYLPGMTSPLHETMIQGRKYERETGVAAYAMPLTKRFGVAGERAGFFSGWEFPAIAESDFSQIVAAGNTTYNLAVNGFFPGNGNAQLIGAPDDVGPTLGTASASRTAASGKTPMWSILSMWVLARGAGGVYVAAAGATLQPFIHSSAATALQLLTALTGGTYNVNGGTTFWTQVALTAPADRAIQKSSGTGAAAGIVQAFFGDTLLTQFITGGALTVPPNTLTAVYELA